MKIIDPAHPFFRPLAVRLGLTVFCLGWGIFEFFIGSQIWAIVFGVFGLISGYEFFINPKNNFDAPPLDKDQTP